MHSLGLEALSVQNTGFPVETLAYPVGAPSGAIL